MKPGERRIQRFKDRLRQELDLEARRFGWDLLRVASKHEENLEEILAGRKPGAV